MLQGASSPPWGLDWLIGREQPVTSTAFQELEINYPDKKMKQQHSDNSANDAEGGGRQSPLYSTWKEYLQLYPDWRMRTVSSIPV